MKGEGVGDNANDSSLAISFLTSRMPSAPQNVTVKRPGSNLPPAADAAPAAAAAATPAAEAMMKRGEKEREWGRSVWSLMIRGLDNKRKRHKNKTEVSEDRVVESTSD